MAAESLPPSVCPQGGLARTLVPSPEPTRDPSPFSEAERFFYQGFSLYPIPVVFTAARFGEEVWGEPRICIADQTPDDADAADPSTPFGEPLSWGASGPHQGLLGAPGWLGPASREYISPWGSRPLRVGRITGTSWRSSRRRPDPLCPMDSTSPCGHHETELYEAPCLHNQLQSSPLQAVNHVLTPALLVRKPRLKSLSQARERGCGHPGPKAGFWCCWKVLRLDWAHVSVLMRKVSQAITAGGPCVEGTRGHPEVFLTAVSVYSYLEMFNYF